MTTALLWLWCSLASMLHVVHAPHARHPAHHATPPAITVPPPRVRCTFIIQLHQGAYYAAACVQAHGPVLYKGEATTDADTFWTIVWEYRDRERGEEA